MFALLLNVLCFSLHVQYFVAEMGDTVSKQSQRDNGEEKKKNPINELQVLEGHSDIVRLLIKVDEIR